MLDEMMKTRPYAKQANSKQTKQPSRLALYGRFLLHWSWYIVLSMTVISVASALIPDIPSQESYQATLQVQVQLPSGFDNAANVKSTSTFFSGLFVSPGTLDLALSTLHRTPKFRTLQLLSLQTIVTAVPVLNTNEILLNALGDTPQDASTLVTSIYQALLQKVHTQRSLVVNGLNTILTNELNNAEIDLAITTTELENLLATHSTSYFQYDQLTKSYEVRLKLVNTLYKMQGLLLQQDFTHSDILSLGSTVPQITTIPGTGPTKAQRLALSPFIGLIMGLGGALLASRFSTALPLSGKKREIVLPPATIVVPALTDLKKKHIQVLEQATSWAIPLLLRLRYQAQEHEKRFRLILITSPKGGEGKSTLATGLALAASRDGLHTLLVDANPQRPVLHTWFQVSNTVGTLDTIRSMAAGGADTSPLLDTSFTKLSVLPIGKASQEGSSESPEGSLRVDGLRPFTDSLTKKGDLIIFDGPSLLSDLGATNLAMLADVVLLVVDAHSSQVPVVLQAETWLSNIGVSPIIVLNRTRPEFTE